MPLGSYAQSEAESKLNEISAYNNVVSAPVTTSNSIQKTNSSSTRRNFQNYQKIE
jgi:hypothetical protein